MQARAPAEPALLGAVEEDCTPGTEVLTESIAEDFLHENAIKELLDNHVQAAVRYHFEKFVDELRLKVSDVVRALQRLLRRFIDDPNCYVQDGLRDMSAKLGSCEPTLRETAADVLFEKACPELLADGLRVRVLCGLEAFPVSKLVCPKDIYMNTIETAVGSAEYAQVIAKARDMYAFAKARRRSGDEHVWIQLLISPSARTIDSIDNGPGATKEDMRAMMKLGRTNHGSDERVGRGGVKYNTRGSLCPGLISKYGVGLKGAASQLTAGRGAWRARSLAGVSSEMKEVQEFTFDIQQSRDHESRGEHVWRSHSSTTQPDDLERELLSAKGWGARFTRITLFRLDPAFCDRLAANREHLREQLTSYVNDVYYALLHGGVGAVRTRPLQQLRLDLRWSDDAPLVRLGRGVPARELEPGGELEYPFAGPPIGRLLQLNREIIEHECEINGVGAPAQLPLARRWGTSLALRLELSFHSGAQQKVPHAMRGLAILYYLPKIDSVESKGRLVPPTRTVQPGLVVVQNGCRLPTQTPLRFPWMLPPQRQRHDPGTVDAARPECFDRVFGLLFLPPTFAATKNKAQLQDAQSVLRCVKAYTFVADETAAGPAPLGRGTRALLEPQPREPALPKDGAPVVPETFFVQRYLADMAKRDEDVVVDVSVPCERETGADGHEEWRLRRLRFMGKELDVSSAERPPVYIRYKRGRAFMTGRVVHFVSKRGRPEPSLTEGFHAYVLRVHTRESVRADQSAKELRAQLLERYEHLDLSMVGTAADVCVKPEQVEAEVAKLRALLPQSVEAAWYREKPADPASPQEEPVGAAPLADSPDRLIVYARCGGDAHGFGGVLELRVKLLRLPHAAGGPVVCVGEAAATRKPLHGQSGHSFAFAALAGRTGAAAARGTALPPGRYSVSIESDDIATEAELHPRALPPPRAERAEGGAEPPKKDPFRASFDFEVRIGTRVTPHLVWQAPAGRAERGTQPQQRQQVVRLGEALPELALFACDEHRRAVALRPAEPDAAGGVKLSGATAIISADGGESVRVPLALSKESRSPEDVEAGDAALGGRVDPAACHGKVQLVRLRRLRLVPQPAGHALQLPKTRAGQRCKLVLSLSVSLSRAEPAVTVTTEHALECAPGWPADVAVVSEGGELGDSRQAWQHTAQHGTLLPKIRLVALDPFGNVCSCHEDEEDERSRLALRATGFELAGHEAEGESGEVSCALEPMPARRGGGSEYCIEGARVHAHMGSEARLEVSARAPPGAAPASAVGPLVLRYRVPLRLLAFHVGGEPAARLVPGSHTQTKLHVRRPPHTPLGALTVRVHKPLEERGAGAGTRAGGGGGGRAQRLELGPLDPDFNLTDVQWLTIEHQLGPGAPRKLKPEPPAKKAVEGGTATHLFGRKVPAGRKNSLVAVLGGMVATLVVEGVAPLPTVLQLQPAEQPSTSARAGAPARLTRPAGSRLKLRCVLADADGARNGVEGAVDWSALEVRAADPSAPAVASAHVRLEALPGSRWSAETHAGVVIGATREFKVSGAAGHAVLALPAGRLTTLPAARGAAGAPSAPAPAPRALELEMKGVELELLPGPPAQLALLKPEPRARLAEYSHKPVLLEAALLDSSGNTCTWTELTRGRAEPGKVVVAVDSAELRLRRDGGECHELPFTKAKLSMGARSVDVALVRATLAVQPSETARLPAAFELSVSWFGGDRPLRTFAPLTLEAEDRPLRIELGDTPPWDGQTAYAVRARLWSDRGAVLRAPSLELSLEVKTYQTRRGVVHIAFGCADAEGWRAAQVLVSPPPNESRLLWRVTHASLVKELEVELITASAEPPPQPTPTPTLTPAQTPAPAPAPMPTPPQVHAPMPPQTLTPPAPPPPSTPTPPPAQRPPTNLPSASEPPAAPHAAPGAAQPLAAPQRPAAAAHAPPAPQQQPAPNDDVAPTPPAKRARTLPRGTPREHRQPCPSCRAEVVFVLDDDTDEAAERPHAPISGAPAAAAQPELVEKLQAELQQLRDEVRSLKAQLRAQPTAAAAEGAGAAAPSRRNGNIEGRKGGALDAPRDDDDDSATDLGSEQGNDDGMCRGPVDHEQLPVLDSAVLDDDESSSGADDDAIRHQTRKRQRV